MAKKKSDSIKLSPKHGLNPSMRICFWCGEEDGIALLGKLPGDKEAPRQVVVDYEPCPKCKEIFSKGIMVAGVVRKPMMENMEPIGYDGEYPLYPDGSHFVASENWVRRLYDNDEDTLQAILHCRNMLMDSAVVHDVIEHQQQKDNDTEEENHASNPSEV